MKKPTVFARKAFVLVAFAGSLLFSGSAPKPISSVKVLVNCTDNGSPCVNLDCQYWQCQIDATYANSYPNQCAAVMATYNSWLQFCPAVSRCNLNLYGCR